MGVVRMSSSDTRTVWLASQVFYLDGEAVVHAALALLFPRVALGTRRRTATALLIAGSLLLVVALAQGLRTLL